MMRMRMRTTKESPKLTNKEEVVEVVEVV